MSSAWPTATLVHLPVHASRLNQIENVFSILQRNVIKPAAFADLEQLGEQIPESRHNTTATPIDWRLTRTDLHALCDRIQAHENRVVA